jgi:hypothetical protein
VRIMVEAEDSSAVEHHTAKLARLFQAELGA